VALLTKIHHAIIDGSSGSDVLAVLADLEADPGPDPEPPSYEPEDLPPRLQRAGRSLGHVLGLPLRSARLGWQVAGQGITVVRSLVSDVTPPQPFQAPRTPFNGRLTPRRTFASASLPMGEVKRVKEAYGVKVNDVALAVSSGALRRYLVARDALPDKPLVAQVPVSIRTDHTRDKVGTQVAAMFTSLATDLAHPGQRLRTIAEVTSSAKEMRQALSARHLQNLTDTTPPAMISLAARMWTLAGLDGRTPPVFNLIISNVPGPPVPVYLAGHRVDAIFPMGPLLYGSGVNFTLFSIGERLDVGLMACPDLMPDVWDLAAELPRALDELVATIDDDVGGAAVG
jgi:diacylglycerol O-acyltransferase / wax synthase